MASYKKIALWDAHELATVNKSAEHLKYQYFHGPSLTKQRTCIFFKCSISLFYRVRLQDSNNKIVNKQPNKGKREVKRDQE